MFDQNDNIDISYLNATFSNRDALHDALADATDGTEPRFYFEGVGYVTLKLEDKTGSTVCDTDDGVIYLGDLLDKLESEGVTYNTVYKCGACDDVFKESQAHSSFDDAECDDGEFLVCPNCGAFDLEPTNEEISDFYKGL